MENIMNALKTKTADELKDAILALRKLGDVPIELFNSTCNALENKIGADNFELWMYSN